VRADEQLFIVDLGSGLRPLGVTLGPGKSSATVLMTHYHYDHIQGLPFFTPLFNPQSVLNFYGPTAEGKRVDQALRDSLVRPYFPVGMEILRAQMAFHEVKAEQTLRFGEAVVRTHLMHHPGGSMGYRFELGGRTLAYCTDVEHDGGEADKKLIEFVRGADVFIMDAMYTPDEYAGKVGGPRVGFGHSTWQFAAQAAHEAGVKHLVLCHHDPGRTDDALDGLVAICRERFSSTTAAKELEQVDV
jgi:phosphoribosyl 1,2-cyclic phosphodiesterase